MCGGGGGGGRGGGRGVEMIYYYCMVSGQAKQTNKQTKTLFHFHQLAQEQEVNALMLTTAVSNTNNKTLSLLHAYGMLSSQNYSDF